MSMPVEPDSYRKAMARFATGVTVITTSVMGRLHGMTANAVASVSLDPPTLLVVVGRSNETHERIPRAGAFTVNILAQHQRWVSERFAEKDPERDPFDEVPWEAGEGGEVFIPGSLAHLHCTLRASHPSGDHTIYLGEVRHLSIRSEGDPLVYFASRYTTVVPLERPVPTGEGR